MLWKEPVMRVFASSKQELSLTSSQVRGNTNREMNSERSENVQLWRRNINITWF